MRHYLSLLVCTLALPAAAYAQSNQACIDYWAVGPSGCQGNRAPEPQPVLPIPQQPQMQKPAPVARPTDPVEQFYQTYDKPPRSFVEFQLNPTPANALAWVKEYQNIINKSSTTAEAWREAEQAYSQYQQTGSLPEEFAQALSSEERQQVMRIVQSDTTAPISFKELAGPSPLSQTFQNAVLGVPNTTPSQAQAKAPAQQGNLSALNRGSRTAAPVGAAESAKLSMATLNKGEDAVPNDVIKVNYYFSAACPFCRQFEPEFSKVQKQFNAKRMEVTCVDMTPGQQVASNKQDGIDCRWRPLGIGEKAANKIRATPSLLIDFGPTKSLELVEGYVEGTQLLSYLNNKVSQ